MVAQIETSTQLTEKRKNESGVEDYESLENVNYVWTIYFSAQNELFLSWLWWVVGSS